MHPALPQELLDKIIDDVSCDLDALTFCALTSRSFRFRSQSHIFAIVHISSVAECDHLFTLLTQNPCLGEFPRHLALTSIDTWIYQSPNFPAILQKMASLRLLFMPSLQILPLQWEALSPETADALVAVFRNPNLQSLEMWHAFNIPVTVLRRDMKLAHLLLYNVTFKGYGDADFQSVEEVPMELRLKHDLELKYLSLGRMPNAAVIAPQMLNAARQSLSTFQWREWLLYSIREESYFTYDFSLLPTLRSLEFQIAVVVGLPQIPDFQPFLRTAFQNIINFIITNPSATHIEQFKICFVTLLYSDLDPNSAQQPERPASTWSMVSEALEEIPQLWGELDRIFDVNTEAASRPSRLEIALGTFFLGIKQAPEDLLAYQDAWRGKIEGWMPLASRRGVLTTEVVPDMMFYGESLKEW
ncbi:hypothetical protein Hypma_004258 [Hypsizygus marmoreus]|uniref:F-box domain-containing protein n=1 Tax=Hypsizygus marmoreus TaxID=39966 RepID=A0A369J6Y7_HYPMA|nr:hypothetical protein Hypma_004258 [Hypsizygus marmoreus]